MAEWAIPLSTLIIVVATFAWNAVQKRHQNGRSAGDRETMLEKLEALELRLGRCQRRLEVCETERARLTNENLKLLRKIAAAEQDT